MTAQAPPTVAVGSKASAESGKGRFGTFAGVFTPNVLTILGLILFLRTGIVVGEAGLAAALVIVVISNLITLLTGLSLSAIATSMRVGTGGNYYIISRSLGLEIGGAIGIPLYLSQALSVAFYVIGFTTALMTLPAMEGYDPRLISTVIVIVFGVIAFVGADIALRIQFVVLAVLAAAIVSFFMGSWGASIPPTLTPHYSEGQSFWTIFALFFPAVTGITVGASMSGDLRDPSRSIPLGTLTSILVTFAIYLGAIWWLATHASPELLRTDEMVMGQIARWPTLILLGVWSATLSSALGSVLAAPRTLQALAQDRLVPYVLGSRLGSPTEPRMAVLVSTAIAVAVVWMGDLDFVAPALTLFFLNTYGMTNLAHAIEILVGNPSYRPRIRVHWGLALLGAIGCYGAMFLIDPRATILAIIASYGVFFYFERRRLTSTWGDLRSGLWFALARFALLRLEGEQWHVKNWRPNILVFTGQPHNREQLTETADWLSHGQGVVSFFQLLVGDFQQLSEQGLRKGARRRIREYIRNRQMQAFAEVDIVDDFVSGALTVSQAHGIGGLEPNAVLMGWSQTADGLVTQLRLLRGLVALEKSVFLLHVDDIVGFGNRAVIDVWWRGRGGNADLMVLIAHLIRQHRSWAGARIRVLRAIDGEEGREQTRLHSEDLLARARVDAESIVIVKDRPDQPFADILETHSARSDLTLIGLNVPSEEQGTEYVRRVDEALRRIGTVLLVYGAQHDDLLDVESYSDGDTEASGGVSGSSVIGGGAREPS